VNRIAAFVALAVLLSACSSSSDPQEAGPTMKALPGATPAPAASPTLTAGWTVTEGVDTPESVYVEPSSGFIFASMIGGQPGDRDGNGRIMKIAANGTVVSASWATGLNAPKGLRSVGGTLWTADIDEVVGIELASGKITSRVKIEGAQFLNDVAGGADGTIYVSDTLLSRIYAVKDGKASTFADGDNLESANGLLVEGERIVVGGWGKPEADFSTKVPGRLFAIDLHSNVEARPNKTLITPKPFANIDGVESDGRGGYIVTDWNKGTILHVTNTGDSRVLRQFKPGTADLAFVAGAKIAIVPHMSENKIAAYDLSDVLK
jgi:hypothetical protein